MRFRVRPTTTLDVLLLTTGLWFLAKLLRYAFPPLFEPLQGIYEVSSTELGIAYSGFMLCYAAMQFPSGVLRDRIGPVRVLATGGAAAGIASLSLAMEAGFLGLVLVMLVIGAGTGVHKTVSVTLLARVYPGRTGRMLGVHDTVGAASGLVAPLAVIAFLGWRGWRSFFVFAGAAGVVIALVAAIRIPRRLSDDGGETKSSTPTIRHYGRLFGENGLLLFIVMAIAVSFAYNGAVAFVPLYLVSVADLSVAAAGILFSVLFAATVVQLLTGELSDRRGRLPILLGCVVLGLVGVTGLLVFVHPVLLAAAIAVFGIGAHGYRPPRDAYLAEVIPDRVAGGGIGLIRTVMMGAGAISPAIVGAMADVFGFRPAFGLLAGALGVAILAVGFLIVAD